MKIYWSKSRYVVLSIHVDGPDARRTVLELRRTDRKVAEEDAQLIRDAFRRTAWVVDAEDPASKSLIPLA